MSDRTADDSGPGSDRTADDSGPGSDRTAEDSGPGSDPTAAAPRESSAGVVGVAFGLLLIVTLVLVVAVQRSQPIDPQELIEASFETDSLPFGLVAAEAARIATGERLVVLEVEGVEEDPRVEVEEPDAEDGPQGEQDDFDWTTLVEGERGTPPVQVFLVWYPPGGGGAAIERLFKDLTWRDLRDFQVSGGRLMTEKDTLAWAGYDADYVIERELERGGTFRDWMRVNLSLPDRVCVLFARWARGRPAAKERIVELLAALRPRAGGDELDEG